MAYTMVDTRWLEPGWQEGVRLRTTGWLPNDWIEHGVKHGVIEPRSDPTCPARLTARGVQLTDFNPNNTTDENIGWLAIILVALQFDQSWFRECPDVNSVRILEEMKYGRELTEKLTAEFCRAVSS